MNDVFLVVTIVGLAASLTFVTAYYLRTRGGWRDTEVGRWLMIFQTDTALLFGAVVANRSSGWWRAWDGRDWVLLGLYTTFALQGLWLLRLLWRDQEDR